MFKKTSLRSLLVGSVSAGLVMWCSFVYKDNSNPLGYVIPGVPPIEE